MSADPGASRTAARRRGVEAQAPRLVPADERQRPQPARRRRASQPGAVAQPQPSRRALANVGDDARARRDRDPTAQPSGRARRVQQDGDRDLSSLASRRSRAARGPPVSARQRAAWPPTLDRVCHSDGAPTLPRPRVAARPRVPGRRRRTRPLPPYGSPYKTLAAGVERLDARRARAPAAASRPRSAHGRRNGAAIARRRRAAGTATHDLAGPCSRRAPRRPRPAQPSRTRADRRDRHTTVSGGWSRRGATRSRTERGRTAARRARCTACRRARRRRGRRATRPPWSPGRPASPAGSAPASEMGVEREQVAERPHRAVDREWRRGRAARARARTIAAPAGRRRRTASPAPIEIAYDPPPLPPRTVGACSPAPSPSTTVTARHRPVDDAMQQPERRIAAVAPRRAAR